MRKNPSLSKASPPRKDGLEIPIVNGIDQEVLREAEGMPEVNMTPNNGGGPNVADAPFANGKDVRSYGSSPSSSPWAGMGGGF